MPCFCHFLTIYPYYHLEISCNQKSPHRFVAHNLMNLIAEFLADFLCVYEEEENGEGEAILRKVERNEDCKVIEN